jgi:hypothetical protein
VRERGFGDFSSLPPEARDNRRHWLMRALNFSVEWIEFDAGADPFAFDSEFETLLLGVRGTVQVTPSASDIAAAWLPANAIAIAPAGRHALYGEQGAACVLIASRRRDLAGRPILNAEAYEPPDARIVPTGRPFRRAKDCGRIQVLPFEQIMASADKPRLKMLQTDTLSINLVDYRGPRDRSALSPHSHASFEQGSLAIAGDFVHHLRTPWGSNADTWRDDEHLRAPSPSLLVVPVELIHTTEGVGEGRHVLLDVFSPPRFDFIANGWVFNARDYVATTGEGVP